MRGVFATFTDRDDHLRVTRGGHVVAVIRRDLDTKPARSEYLGNGFRPKVLRMKASVDCTVESTPDPAVPRKRFRPKTCSRVQSKERSLQRNGLGLLIHATVGRLERPLLPVVA